MGLDGIGLALAFASSAADACHEATQKAMASYMPHPELALALKSGIIATVFLGSYFQQEPDAWSRMLVSYSDRNFLTAWAVAGLINVGANFLMIMGMKRGKMSDTVPFLSLSPVFLLASGYILLGELADGRGMVGVLVIAMGGFWLSRSGAADEDAQSEKKSFVTLPPGAGIYIFIAMIQSVSSAFDKRGVRAAAAPILYGATISGTVASCALIKFAWQQWNELHTEAELPAIQSSATPAPAAPATPADAARQPFPDTSSLPMQRQTSPTPVPGKMLRRNSSSFLADIMASDIWEVLPDADADEAAVQPEASRMRRQTTPEQRQKKMSRSPSGLAAEVHEEEESEEDGLSDESNEAPPMITQTSPQNRSLRRNSSSFLSTPVFQAVQEENKENLPDVAGKKSNTSQPEQVSKPIRRMSSQMFIAPEGVALETPECAEVKPQETASFAVRWGLMLLACGLKMMAYWCQLKANERIYSSHLSAIRKSGVLLVLLLGKVLFDEEIGNKLLPVGTMLAGVAILAAK